MGRCLIPIWRNDNFWVGHFMNITGMCPRIFLRTTMPPLRTPIVRGSVPRLMLAPMPRHGKITEQNELQELRKVLGRICTNVASSLWIQNINQALFLKTGNNGSILIQRLKKREHHTETSRKKNLARGARNLSQKEKITYLKKETKEATGQVRKRNMWATTSWLRAATGVLPSAKIR